MKKILRLLKASHISYLITIISLLISQISFSQTFQKYYDRDLGTNSIGEVGHAVIQTSDGGFLAVGYSENYGIGMKDLFAVRLDINGDTVWTKLYGNAGGNDMARSVVQTTDGGFAIAAETQSGAGGIDAVIMKIDAVGNLLWSKAFGGIKNELGHSIIEMSDESLILAGQALSYSATSYDEIFLVKVDKDGNHLWSKTLSGGSGEIARSISKTADGGFIIAGDENSINYGVCMVKFTSNGDTAWSHTYRAGYSSYEGFSASQTSDGGYIMAANTYGGSIGGIDMIALKVTATGDITWTKEIGTVGTEQVSDIIQTNDGGYVISGTATPGGTYYDMVLSKLSSSGNMLWSKNFSSQYGTSYAMDSRFQVSQTSDNGLVAIGNIYNNFGNTLTSLYNGFDMLVVKTDPNGEGISFGCIKNANLMVATANWTVYNTPFTITTVNPTITNTVFAQKFTAGNFGNTGVRINLSTTLASCGSCDGSATANACDTSGSFCSGANPWTYLWSNSQTNQTNTGLCNGSYIVTVTDYAGCSGIDTVMISTGAIPQDICLVTVDTSSTKNLIIWEKPITTSIDSFRIYREIGLNNYVKIGAVAYEEPSKFTDNVQGINPNTTSYRYKIAAYDNCGNESVKSNHHRTIHLSTPQFTPPQTFDLIWTNNYEGFEISQYYILRDGNNTGNWVIIDSVSFGSNSYTDLYAPSDSTTYLIQAVHPAGCMVTKSSENHNSSRSNKTYPLSAPGGIGTIYEDAGFGIYPNPNEGSFELFMRNSDKFLSPYEGRIYNVLGEVIYSLSNPTSPLPLLIDLTKNGKGIYFIYLNNGERNFVKKVSVE